MAVFRAPVTPGQRWWSGTGTATPAAGYLLFQYLAGGATPQATFTDGTGNTANANPIVLDADGSLEAAGPGGTAIDLWFTGGIAYRLLLTDASQAPLPGNPVWSVDNLTGVNDPAFASPNTGEWITGAAATWLSSAATAAGTVFSQVGDTRSILQPNRRVRLVSANGDLPGTIAAVTFAANLTTVTVDMQRNAAGAYPTVANPITALYYAIENTGASAGLPAGIPSRALELGFPRYPSDGSARTGVDLNGPIGSNLQVFTAPPPTLVMGGGTVTNGGVGGALRLIFAAAHGLREGEAVQLTSTNTFPGGTAAATTYLVHLDPNAPTLQINLYPVPAGWIYRVPLLTAASPGGLTFGALIAFSSTGAGTLTVTPGWVAPPTITRVKAEGNGGGGGGGGGTVGGVGGTGGGSGSFSRGLFATSAGTFYPIVIGAGGNGGSSGGGSPTVGNATTFFGISVPGALANGGSAPGTGGILNIGGGAQTLGTGSLGATGASSIYGYGGVGGLGANVGQNPMAPGAGGGGGGSTGGASFGGGPGAAGIVLLEW